MQRNNNIFSTTQGKKYVYSVQNQACGDWMVITTNTDWDELHFCYQKINFDKTCKFLVLLFVEAHIFKSLSFVVAVMPKFFTS